MPSRDPAPETDPEYMSNVFVRLAGGERTALICDLLRALSRASGDDARGATNNALRKGTSSISGVDPSPEASWRMFQLCCANLCVVASQSNCGDDPALPAAITFRPDMGNQLVQKTTSNQPHQRPPRVLDSR
jgi:hypothetical protein